MSTSTQSLIERLNTLKSAEARTLLNEIRRGGEDVALANGLVDYYWTKCARYVATNAIQAITAVGNHDHFAFMLNIIRKLSKATRNGSDDYAFDSAIRGAGRLGMPDDIIALLDAGDPWVSAPPRQRADPDEWISSEISTDIRQESVERFEEGERYLFALSRELARSIVMMLAKRDGKWITDLHHDYTYRIKAYVGPNGKGPPALAREVMSIVSRYRDDDFGFFAEVASRIDDNMREVIKDGVPIDHGLFVGALPPQPKIAAPAPLFCINCGFRTDAQVEDTTGTRNTTCRLGNSLIDEIVWHVAEDERDNQTDGRGFCGRCIFVSLREWLVDTAGYSPHLWEFPPRDAPVTAQQYAEGETYWNEKQFEWDTEIYRPPPGQERSLRRYNDAAIGRIRERGPHHGTYFYLMQHLSKWVRTTLTITPDSHDLSFALLEEIRLAGAISPKMLFELWQGDYYLACERDTKWVSEHACVQIIADILGETPVRQWTTSWLVNPATGQALRVDGYFPKHRLAIEYQGQQHFQPVGVFGGTEAFEATRIRDQTKARLLYENNVRLVCVRYDQATRELIRKTVEQVLV